MQFYKNKKDAYRHEKWSGMQYIRVITVDISGFQETPDSFIKLFCIFQIPQSKRVTLHTRQTRFLNQLLKPQMFWQGLSR